MVMIMNKGIIPSAGLATRFLPITKTISKAMLPILNKPALHYIIEEGSRAGISDFVIISDDKQQTIDDYFNQDLFLQNMLLAKKNNNRCLKEIENLSQLTNMLFIRQKTPLGLGHAISCAKIAANNEPVAILLPDDIITGATPAMSQIIKVAQQERANVVGVQEIELKDASKYGIIAIKKQFSPNLFQVKELVEKPKISESPSNLAIVGRYFLSPSIFGALEEMKSDTDGEIQLTDAIQHLLLNGEKVFAYKVQGERYDIGTPMGLIKANISFALKNPDYADEIMEYLQNLEKSFLILQGKAENITLQQTNDN